MLNVNELTSQIQSAFEKYLGPALETAFRQTMPGSSEAMDETAENFGKAVIEMSAEPMATAIAGAIDYYVRSISISGTIITVGGPTTQQATINSPSAVTNGLVPNSLGIN